MEDRASARKARMISASRCSMVMRRAYWVMSGAGGGLVVVGDDDGGLVAAQPDDDQLADGAGVAGQGDGGVLAAVGIRGRKAGSFCSSFQDKTSSTRGVRCASGLSRERGKARYDRSLDNCLVVLQQARAGVGGLVTVVNDGDVLLGGGPRRKR